LKEWTYIFNDLGLNSYTTDWQIDFSACQEELNYISVRAYDYAENITTTDDVFSIRKDTILPAVTGNQMGDETWRNSGGTTYDIDFSDSNSLLNYSQYKITTSVGQGGTVLKGWTNIFDDLGQNTYTTDWQIDFSACKTADDVFYVRKDTTLPTVMDNQDGDNNWRNSAGTIYDIDFSDYNSVLNYAQYKMTTSMGQDGTILKDWTNIFADLGLSSYTTDWQIDFSAGQEGLNYISVRVYDYAGNIKTTDDVFYVRKDTTLPTVADNQIGDDTWKNSGGTTYDVDFSDPNSLLNYSQYKITTSTGQGGTILKDWTNIFTNLGLSSYTTDWQIDFSACQEGLNYISVRVHDCAENIETREDIFFVKVDLTDPSCTNTLVGTMGNNGWYIGDVTVSLAPSDALSGVNRTMYCIDEGSWETYAGQFIVSGDGVHTVEYYTVDNASNTETTNSVQIDIDLIIEPPIDIIGSPSDWTNINSFTVSWANPTDTSGVVGVYYKKDSIPTSDTDGTYVSGDDITSITGINFKFAGQHTVYVWLKDKAGNIQYLHSNYTYLYLDVQINSPIDVVASPSGWTQVNSFTVSWTNPSDQSGIGGAYYKLDIPPTSSTDGTYVIGNDISSISDLTLHSTGEHQIYIWLKDNAGNVNHNKDGITTLHLAFDAPMNLTAEIWSNNICLNWSGSVLADHYLIYRSISFDSFTFSPDEIIYNSSSNPGHELDTSWNDTSALSDTANDYFYVLRAVDIGHHQSNNSNMAGKFLIVLEEGWNMISIPLIQSDTRITAAFQTISGYYDIVETYNASTDTWHNSNSDLTDINHKMGLWIHMRLNDILTVAGIVPETTEIELHAGWNFIGYPSLAIRNLDDALSGVSWNAIQRYDASDTNDSWKDNTSSKPLEMNDLFEMRPGYGYWVNITEVTVWVRTCMVPNELSITTHNEKNEMFTEKTTSLSSETSVSTHNDRILLKDTIDVSMTSNDSNVGKHLDVETVSLNNSLILCLLIISLTVIFGHWYRKIRLS